MSSPTDKPFQDASGKLPEEAWEWLAEHPDVKGEELEEIWRLAERASTPAASFPRDAKTSAAMREQILAQISSPQLSGRRKRPNILHMGRTWAVAASILLAATIGTIILVNPVVVTSPAGELEKVALSDGSEVLLNSGSALKYRRWFGWWGRSVDLEGEAFFDVASGSDPFEVHTFNGIVTVVGTHFDVRAWPKDAAMETRVILTEGTVRFSANSTPESRVVLHAGQMSRITGRNGSPSEPVDVDADRLLVWRTGGLAFFDVPVEMVLADVQRRFNVEITTTKDIRERRLSLFMSEVPDVEAVLHVLATTHGLEWRRQGNAYEIKDAESMPDAQIQ